MPARHAVYGGSNASQWLNCPGGVVLRTQVPRRPAGPAALHGSAQHEIMEQLLIDPDRRPSDFLGSTVLGVRIDPTHVAAIELALEEFEKIEATFGAGAEMYSEREVMLFEDAFGTLDAALIEGDRAAIIDFKFGAGEVAADSDQGKTYAVYARRSMPTFAKVKHFELYIIQPALDPATDKVILPAAEIDAFEASIVTAIRVSKQPQAPFVEGSWCKWCDAKLACPAKTQRLDTLTAPNHILDLAELGERLKVIKSWEKWAEEAQARILHEIEAGTAVPGWKLVAKRAVRSWTDETRAIETFRKHKIPASRYLKTELVSPAQAEKILPKTIVNGLAQKVSSGNTVAPSDDPRPEVFNTAAVARVLQRLA